MPDQPFPTAIAVVAHPQLHEASIEAEIIAAFLKEHDVTVAFGSIYDAQLRSRIEDKEFTLVIALGGDGTMLRAGHLCAPHNIPILGINLGHFGFLMEFGRDQWQQMLPKLLEGKYWLEKRMMLRCEHWRKDQLQGLWDVVNEAVVCRGQMVRPVHLTTCVDGRFLTTYVADGLIVASPTGSTAYALAAGGPILHPELRNILLVPVAPHLSVDRSIVLAEGSSVDITISTDHPAILCPDGQNPITLENDDLVAVHSSDYTVQFVRFQDPGYFYRNLTPHMNQNPSTGTLR